MDKHCPTHRKGIASNNVDNPKVEIRQCPKFGMGLNAAELIRKGEEIASFDGEIYTWSDPDENLPNTPPLFIEDHAVPISEWSARDSAGFARVANHSCDPNCGIVDGIRIVARVDIPAGTAITWDYDMAQDDGIWDMVCRCGSVNCRGRIAGYRFLSSEQRTQYEGFISSWLLESERPFIGSAVEVLGAVDREASGGRIGASQPNNGAP
jgi:hypothetical protein